MRVKGWLVWLLVISIAGVVGCSGRWSTPDVSGLAISASATSLTADGTSTSTITATLTDEDSAAVPNHTITFSVTGGGSLSAATGVTDSAGKVTVTYTAGTASGTAKITATDTTIGVSGVSATQNITLLAGSMTVTSSSSTLTAEATSTATITATLANSSGTALESYTVNFSITSGSGSLSAASATTNSSGKASVTYTAGTTVGTVTIKASATVAGDTVSNTVNITLTAISSAVVNISKSGANMAAGGVAMGNSAATIGSTAATTTSSLSLKKVRMLDSGPPDTFFTTDLLNPTSTDAQNGYVRVMSDGTDTVKIRIKTRGTSGDGSNGEYVASSYLTGKQLGTMGTFSWRSIFSQGFPTNAQIQSFAASPSYQTINCLGYYLSWTFVIPTHILPALEQIAQQAAFSLPQVTVPTAEAKDKIAYMEGIMNHADASGGTGTMTMTITTGIDGKPTSATGSGTMTDPTGRVFTVASGGMTITFVDGSPSSISMIGTTSDNYTVTMTTNVSGYTTGPETVVVDGVSCKAGSVKDSSGTLVSYIIIDATGTRVVDTAGNEQNI